LPNAISGLVRNVEIVGGIHVNAYGTDKESFVSGTAVTISVGFRGAAREAPSRDSLHETCRGNDFADQTAATIGEEDVASAIDEETLRRVNLSRGRGGSVAGVTSTAGTRNRGNDACCNGDFANT